MTNAIDWQYSLKMAGNNADIAKEMLSLLVKSLPEDLLEIKQLAMDKNDSLLARKLHQFQGGVSYCGVPRLKQVIIDFQSALKKNGLSIGTEYLALLESEVNQVIDQAPEYIK